jgi:hypothetical protein
MTHRTRAAWAAVLGAIVVSAAFAVSAQAAELPELGRCVAVTRGTGEYSNGRCLQAVAGTGSHDWLSGPGAEKKFEGSTSEPVLLETVGRRQVHCNGAATYSGEYTGPKTATVNVKLTECADSITGLPCQTLPIMSGTIEAAGLEAELGFIRRAVPPQIGWDLKKSPSLVMFECSKLPETLVLGTVTGSVIGRVGHLNSMSTEGVVRFAEGRGRQSPENFEGGPQDVLTTKFETGTVMKVVEEEQTGLKAKFSLANFELLEIRDKCEGAGC